MTEQWARLAQIETTAATHHDVSIEHVRASLKRPYGKLQGLPEFNLSKQNTPIALAGGGPSIRETVDELRKFPVIVAAGSSHDWLIENGIVPRYCVVCDPDEVITAKYLTKPHPACNYLIATQCHESVFKAVEGYPVTMWHCFSQEHTKLLDEEEPNWMAVSGGCTAGLRAVSIAIMFGYNNMHFFGYDSCLGISDDAHHAYDFATNDEELGRIFTLRMGQDAPGERVYRCAGYQLAQAVHFKSFLGMHAARFTPTFHGPGLLTDMWNDISTRAAIMKEVEEAA